jgi:predicted extracellular nuclease
MRLRCIILLMFGLLAVPAAASASPSGVVISQLRLRTSTSSSDQYVQITNTTGQTVDLSGWRLYDCYQSGSTQKIGSDGNALASGTTLPAGRSFVFGYSYGGQAYSGITDATYSYSVNESGGFQLRDATGTAQDGVGAPGTLCAEGTGLTLPTTGSDFTVTRKSVDGTLQDTDDNSADFNAPSGQANGTACGGSCAAPPAGSTPIDTLTGNFTKYEGDKVTVSGIVIGVDNQQDVSDYVNLQPETAGIYVETPTALQDSDPTTSEGIFVGGLPAADRTADHIGETVSVTGIVDNLYGLRTIDATGQSPTYAGTGGTANLPAPVIIDPTQAAAQTVSTSGDRPYYDELQGERVELQEGVANSGGTDKFGELYLDTVSPYSETSGDGLNLAGYTTPLGPPDLLDVTQDAGSSDVDPTNPDAEPPSTTRVNANLHDHVFDVVGPMGFDFDDYDIVPQPGDAPTVVHDGVRYPPSAPRPEAGTIRIANFNMENLFGAGMTDDGHTYTQAEVDLKTTRLANAIELMHKPDIITDEEVASPVAYAEIASKLGDYTSYWVASNDDRHIAVGFLVKRGIKVTGLQQLGKTATTTLTGCNDSVSDDPQLFERPPLALSVEVHGLKFTLIGNHLASLGHPEACREAQADYINSQVKSLEAQGTHVMVIGDLNDYQDSPALATDLIAGTTLQDLFFQAPADDAYSFQYDGQLETLDHIFTDSYLSSLFVKIRYVHFDNDYAGVSDPDSPIEVSDHDPPVAVLRIPLKPSLHRESARVQPTPRRH